MQQWLMDEKDLEFVIKIVKHYMRGNDKGMEMAKCRAVLDIMYRKRRDEVETSRRRLVLDDS